MKEAEQTSKRGSKRKRKSSDRKQAEGGGSDRDAAFGGERGAKLFGNYVGYNKRRRSTAEGELLEVDSRVDLVRAAWLEGKDVVDLGCNDGAVLIEIARRFSIANGTGVDIDDALVKKARENLQKLAAAAGDRGRPLKGSGGAGLALDWVPLSLQLAGRSRRPVEPTTGDDGFPFNLKFVCADMTEEGSGVLSKTSCDVVLLLSVTKWVHLHGGDKKVKNLFQRIFDALRPNGVFILEPQPFHTYKRKIKLREDLRFNYSRIKLKPEKFVEYLVKKVGFIEAETLRELQLKGQKFNRAVYMLRKKGETD